ncbi:hypothetical protein B0F90DRAFT_764106 [Multifurca ochricompacta]|uniref:Uncharacterized protein n=1 Tax=Multifurca ochricompacta TaxID=376703 RepID=A0AAD4QS02_9AGAM|nr:hypothetical protein B0F90DRAFT_764106 [Multifurca ochricompacta]
MLTRPQPLTIRPSIYSSSIMNIPYQAYKSKRHSRTLSNNKLILSPSPSPPRPSSVHDSPPVQVQPQHPRHPSEEAQGSVSDDLHTIRLPSVSSPSTLVPISTSSDPAHEASSQETASRPPPQPLTVTASPPASSVAISNTKPTMSSSSTSPTTSMTTRRNSTFRRIPSRAALAPVIPSPLNPGNNSRTASLPLRHLDPNSGLTSHRRLSTVTLLSTSPQAEPSQDVPVGRAAL